MCVCLLFVCMFCARVRVWVHGSVCICVFVCTSVVRNVVVLLAVCCKRAHMCTCTCACVCACAGVWLRES